MRFLDILIQLLKLKFMPMLLHDLEVCQLPRRDLQSLDFMANRFLRNCLEQVTYVLSSTVKKCLILN